MRLVASYVRMHPKPFAASVAGAVLFAFASLWLTEALGRATDDVLRPAFEGEVESREVWLAVGALMLGGVGRALGIMLRRYYSGVAGERVMATLRTRVAERYRELSLRFHRETPTGELLAHMEADVKAAVDVFWPVPFAMGVIVLTLLALVALLVTDPVLSLVGLVVFPSLAIMNRIFARRIEEPSRLAQERIGDVSAVAHESIDGALVVKTLGREYAETQRLLEKARALRDERVRAGVVRASFEAALDALPTMAIALLLAVGVVACVERCDHARRPHRVRGPVPTAVVADAVHRMDPRRAAASRRGLRPARGGLRRTGHRDAAATGRAASRRTAGAARTRAAPAVRAAVAGARGRDLRGLSPASRSRSSARPAWARARSPSSWFDSSTPTRATSRSAASICARSTLHRCARRSRSCSKRASCSRRACARTSRSTLGRPTDEVVHAAEIASCDRFIRALPHGYDTIVGERGLTLSGGERQRVALARALVRTPRLLILDDATSAVDPSIEAEILGALRKELSTTLVVVAYRLSTIRLADRVIFLRRGRVEATGSHDELLATQPGYGSIIKAYERGER